MSAHHAMFLLGADKSAGLIDTMSTKYTTPGSNLFTSCIVFLLSFFVCCLFNIDKFAPK